MLGYLILCKFLHMQTDITQSRVADAARRVPAGPYPTFPVGATVHHVRPSACSNADFPHT